MFEEKTDRISRAGAGAAPVIFNEWQDADGRIRDHYAPMAQTAATLGYDELSRRWEDGARQVGLDAFTFYLDPKRFRPTPADWIPRVVPRDHWQAISAGVAQRLKAINRFLVDLYDRGQDIVPEEVVYTSQHFYPDVQGFRPARDLFVHVYGIDLVHLGDGRYAVLEDNLRIPSGISYQLKTVELAARVVPELAGGYDIAPYAIRSAYLEMFRSLCDSPSPVCVLLTDGRYGSAFFEHRYLSDLLGIPLVEGADLYVGHDGRVYARTLDGDFAVDLVYRRVEDLEMFVPGLREAYLDRRVVLVKGIGTGVADDKLVFLWVPRMIERYLGESPLLEQAPSYNLQDAGDRRYVLENLERMVIKARQGYGGIGVFVMPDLGPAYKTRVAHNILENPELFIAQETLDFSQHVVLNRRTGMLEPRHVDLRVFAVQAADGKVTVFPGGLTRVALEGGRITNNSSGGLCKPTWVVD